MCKDGHVMTQGWTLIVLRASGLQGLICKQIRLFKHFRGHGCAYSPRTAEHLNRR